MEQPTRDLGYRKATEHILRGHPREAVSLLGAVPEDRRSPEDRFALGKAHLELGRHPDALACLEPLAGDPPAEDGAHGYLLLLLAAALAGVGRADDARSRLEEVPQLEPALERAARALLRRIEAGEAPEVRF